MYVITSFRYKEEQNFQEMLEEVVNQWEETKGFQTEGFQTQSRQEPSESSTGSKNKENTLNNHHRELDLKRPEKDPIEKEIITKIMNMILRID